MKTFKILTIVILILVVVVLSIDMFMSNYEFKNNNYFSKPIYLNKIKNMKFPEDSWESLHLNIYKIPKNFERKFQALLVKSGYKKVDKLNLDEYYLNQDFFKNNIPYNDIENAYFNFKDKGKVPDYNNDLSKIYIDGKIVSDNVTISIYDINNKVFYEYSSHI